MFLEMQFSLVILEAHVIMSGISQQHKADSSVTTQED